MAIGIGVRQSHSQELLQEAALEVTFERRLETREDWLDFLNQKHSMGPTHLKKTGKITDQWYKDEKDRFSDFDRIYTGGVLRAVNGYRPARKNRVRRVRAHGLGEGDTVLWMPEAWDMGFLTEGHDWCPVTIQNTVDTLMSYFIQRPGLSFRLRDIIQISEIEELVTTASPKKYLLDHISRVAQHWALEKVWRTFRGLGEQSEPGKGVVVLVHYFDEDNPNYHASTSFPHKLKCFEEALSEGAGRKWINLHQSQPLPFFEYQRYRWTTLGPSCLKRHFKA